MTIPEQTYPTGLARFVIVLTTISAAIMELIDTSIVNVALTDISGSLGATIEDVSWVITSYAIANVIIIPMTGFLARYFGRKNYYITSMVIFTIASYMCGNAGSLVELVAWRFMQGIGGGALLSTSQSILFDAFEPKKRAIASAMFGMGIVLGPTLGPTLGGYIIDHAAWPLIFYINLPFGILAVTLTMLFIDKKPEEYNINRKAITIDYTGILLLAIGVSSLQYFLERGETEDWLNSQSIRITGLLALFGLAAFIWHELRDPHPVIDLRVIKNRNLLASNVLTFVCGFALFGSVFIFPVLVQRVLGYTPLEAGIGIIPGSLMSILFMPIIGASLSKGVKPIVFVALGFVAFILHGYFSAQANLDATRSWFIFAQVLRGIGASCLIVPLINQAVIGIAPKEMPYAISLTNMLRQLGGSFGIAIMNTYVATRVAVHRNDLISNLTANDPETMERLKQGTAIAISKGYDATQATGISLGFMERSLSQQTYLLAYLDGFLLISVFLICAIPFIFLLRTQKQDAATLAKVSEEAH
jgi:DHA2 family multidrug resistance protein